MKQYIDEIIRDKKREFYKDNPRGILPELSFYWGREGYEQLRRFLAAVLVCPHGLNCFCSYGDKVVDNYLKVQPVRFLGVDNYWDRRKKGFCLLVTTKKRLSE